MDIFLPSLQKGAGIKIIYYNYCIMLFSEFLELLSNANDGNDHSERNESGKRDEASEEKSHSSGNLKDEKEHYTDEQDNAVRR